MHSETIPTASGQALPTCERGESTGLASEADPVSASSSVTESGAVGVSHPRCEPHLEAAFAVIQRDSAEDKAELGDFGNTFAMRLVSVRNVCRKAQAVCGIRLGSYWE